MQGVFLRKYGVETTINFQLFEVDGVDFRVDAAHAAGDTKIMKDEGAEANTTNGFVDEGQGYSITLSATEMEAARIVVYVVDQGAKAWLDAALVVETYGHASAMHAFDLDSATVTPADGSITAAVVATGAIDADAIADNAIDAGAIATDAIDADALAADAVTEIADGLLKRNWASVSGEAARSVLNALRFLRNKVAISGATLTVYKEDDSTSAWTGTVTTDSGADPVTVVDPA